MNEHDLKIAFAEALMLSPMDPHKAAFVAIPDTGMALQVALAWRDDPVVIAHIKSLLTNSNGLSGILPSKQKQALDIYTMATDPKIDPDDRLKAHRLFAEIMEHIPKESKGGAVNILNQGVMIVRDQGTDEEWEQRAIASQNKLIEGGHATAN